MIDHGRVIAQGTADELKARTGGQLLAVRVAGEHLAHARAALAPLGEVEAADDGTLTVAAPDGGAFVVRAARLLADAGVPLDEISLRRPTLDDVFLQLTGRPPAGDEEPAA